MSIHLYKSILFCTFVVQMGNSSPANLKNRKDMLIKLETFRGYMVSTNVSALENAKLMMCKLIDDGIRTSDLWVKWTDEEDNDCLLTFFNGDLKLHIIRKISIELDLTF